MSAGRILVVDDEPQIRRIMRSTLTGAGYEIADAKSGEEALDRIRDFRPDLVLLDMNMPGMGGLEACRAIRADSQAAIIMLTVRNTEKDKVEALDAGADDFVTKPFGMPELQARIRAAMRRLPAQAGPTRLKVGDVVIDFGARTVNNGATTSHLTPKELASRVIAGRLGPRLRRASRLFASLHQESPQENRAKSGNPAVHYDRTLGRLSF